MLTSTRRWLFVTVVAATTLFIDQFTKYLARENLDLYESVQPIKPLGNFFQFTRTFNTGSAFGFLPEAGDIFLILAVVIIAAMLYFYPRIPEEALLTRLGTGLIVGGALGNALDRIQFEYVIDFIHYRIPGIISNVSNLADHAIVLGVTLLFIDNWRMDQQRQLAEQDTQDQKLPYNES